MPFDPANYNLDATDVSIATHLNNIVEAVSDGVSVSDALPILQGLMGAFSALNGKPATEIRTRLAKASVANVFDELAERAGED